MMEFEGSPKTWPPLGLPTGSVRALLALILVAVVVTRMVRIATAAPGEQTGPQEDFLWVEALLIALSHYFTSRRFVELPPEVLRQLEDDGVLERERHPLFLPRNSIRVIIVGAFCWLAYYLYSIGHLYEHHAASFLGMLAAFALGAIVRRIGLWWHRGRPYRGGGTWGDLKALLVIIALLIVAIPEFLGSPNVLPTQVHQVVLGMMLFYFGSR